MLNLTVLTLQTPKLYIQNCLYDSNLQSQAQINDK